MARIVSLIVLTALILFLSVTFYRVVAPFLLPLFLAGIVAALCQPLFRFLIRKTRGRVRLSAGLTTASILMVILVPASIGTFVAASQLVSLTTATLANTGWRAEARSQLDAYVARNAERLAPYLAKTDLPDITDPEKRKEAVAELTDRISTNLDSALRGLAQKTIGSGSSAAGVASAAAGVAVDVLGTTAGFLLSSLIFLVALYYFLADGPDLLSAAENLVPLHAEYQRQLLERFEKVVRAVILSTFLAAIAQGVLTACAIWIVGIHHFLLLLVISTLAALIPLVGTWVVWAPTAAWLAYQGNWGSAIFLFLFGAAVIGMVDNVIRAWVLQSDAQLHPLLAFVSVLGGLQVMGLWGVFVGPVVASCLYALVKIFNFEIHELSKERFAPGATGGLPAGAKGQN